MPFPITLEPHDPRMASIMDAEPEDDSRILDECFETNEWRPIRPAEPLSLPEFAFVDGVQRLHRRITVEKKPWPIKGIIASYGAGAALPARGIPVTDVTIGRTCIIGEQVGERLSISTHATNGVFKFEAETASDDAREALNMKLQDLRAAVETKVVRGLTARDVGLVVVDGRLPPDAGRATVGLIKTPHRMPVSDEKRREVLFELRAGERSPLIKRVRSEREYGAFFLCLRTPGPRESKLSGLALMEMELQGKPAKADTEMIRTADLVSYCLPRYASAPERDPRAPQNTLPVGQLERELHHLLGSSSFVSRLINEAMAKETFTWT